eukprot:TRINITY_DN28399_c0_g1_i2.p1 TRINITY_DN28399_c0_g1~~TRINITY_DN28399_c0_g1_i2.p1  ORF type:complete len:267 (-),score=-56.62 TRINITY_DN28399_c0_g1_i2:438-1139(-)
MLECIHNITMFNVYDQLGQLRIQYQNNKTRFNMGQSQHCCIVILLFPVDFQFIFWVIICILPVIPLISFSVTRSHEIETQRKKPLKGSQNSHGVLQSISLRFFFLRYPVSFMFTSSQSQGVKNAGKKAKGRLNRKGFCGRHFSQLAIIKIRFNQFNIIRFSSKILFDFSVQSLQIQQGNIFAYLIFESIRQPLINSVQLVIITMDVTSSSLFQMQFSCCQPCFGLSFILHSFS